MDLQTKYWKHTGHISLSSPLSPLSKYESRIHQSNSFRCSRPLPFINGSLCLSISPFMYVSLVTDQFTCFTTWLLSSLPGPCSDCNCIQYTCHCTFDSTKCSSWWYYGWARMCYGVYLFPARCEGIMQASVMWLDTKLKEFENHFELDPIVFLEFVWQMNTKLHVASPDSEVRMNYFNLVNMLEERAS